VRPIDVATNDSVEFVQQHLPPGSQRILEVGCGRGEVASQLQEKGHQLIAIDSNEEAVAQARKLGVDARLAQWPDFEDTPFDAILFTSSLHHITPLTEALNQAHRLLVPSGVLIVDEFAYEAIDLPTSEWCYSLALLLKDCQALQTKAGFIMKFLEGGGEFDHWQHFREHGLHPASIINKELKQIFPHVNETKEAYLYRYFLPALAETEQGFTLATNLLELEKRMGRAGGIQPIGRRFVAHK
jgi:ubiquinone/menaquinone biosynthesis C-methylase UbiE